MLQNYLKIALRTLWKQKSITAINVVGMAAGMAVCLLVGMLLWDQMTHDDFHPGADRLYRVVMETEEEPDWAATPADLAPALGREVAGVEVSTRMTRVRGDVVVDGQRYSARGYYAEPSFFEVFGFELSSGRESDALAGPGSAVVSEDLARRLFGDTDPVGQTFTYADSVVVTVTGVIDQDAYRSHLTFDVLYAFEAMPKSELTRLGNTYSYVQLAAGRGPADIAPSLRGITEKYLSLKLPGVSPTGFRLQALSDIPLSGQSLMMENEGGVLRDPTLAHFLTALALLVLLAASFNYVNLSAARSLTRGREVGVRKVLGAHRRQVMGPFLAEAVLVALGALALGVVAVEALIPAFNGLSVVYGNDLQIEIQPGLGFYGTFVLFAASIGLLAGFYPAWHLSNFEPASILRSTGSRSSSRLGWMSLRKVLTVLQFAVALVVIVTAALLYRQTAHMSAADELGFQTEHLLHVDLQGVGYEPFRQMVRQVSGVERVGGASHLPLTWRTAGVRAESNRVAEPVTARSHAVDYEVVEALDLPLLASGEWSEQRFETGRVVLISETASQQLGFSSPREAVGEPLRLSRFRESQEVRVAGVVGDIYLSFSDKPGQPIIYQYDSSRFQVALMQVKEGQQQAVLEALGAAWNQFGVGDPLQAQSYRSLIASDDIRPLEEAGWVLGFVAGLAVLISSLGLLGIATYQVQIRTREIGIRKTLGATVASVVGLLSKDVLWLIGAALALGIPTAWWLNQLWLQSFAYRIELSGVAFILGGATVIGIAVLALAPQVVRVAYVNPAETLREE